MKSDLKKRAAAVLCLAAAIILCACGGEPLPHTYQFPENGLASLVSQGEGEHAAGFAADLCVPASDADLNTEDVNAEAFGLFDVTRGEVISQHNLNEKVYPASTTKILTCLIALEHGDPDAMVTVPKESEITVSGSSMADLKPGDRLPLRDLLYGLMVPSGNDAAVAIAHHIGGDMEHFAALMNQKAAGLGATHCHFTNPHGLPDEDHYVTVYDMYLIFNEAMKNEEFRKISRTAEYTCTVENENDASADGRQVTWTSGNGFYNGKFPFAEGMEILCGKTGHTNAAGFCLVLGESSADGGTYISIIMKSPVYESLYASMRHLAAKSAG